MSIRFVAAITIAFSYLVSGVVFAQNLPIQDAHLPKFKHAVDLLDSYRGNTSLLETARDELEDMLKANPRFAPAYREMARYFIMAGYISSLKFKPGALEAADMSIKKALEFNPNFAEAYVLYGHLYRLMHRHQDALSALEKAEQLGTTDPWLQNNWADLLIDEGKYEAAALRYRKVIESKTLNKKAMGSAFGGLIRYYQSVDQLDLADEMYRKNIDFEPDTAWNYGNYAQFLLCSRDDYNKSIYRSREALDIMNYGVARYWLAAALYRKWADYVLSGEPKKGEPFFLEARAIYPDLDGITANTKTCKSLSFISQALIAKKTVAS